MPRPSTLPSAWATSGSAASRSTSLRREDVVVPIPNCWLGSVPAGRTTASGVEPLMMLSKVEPSPVLNVSTPVRKPMPSTIASVLMSSRTLRANRLRSVSRSTGQPTSGVSRAMASRIDSRSGSRSSSTILPSARNTTRSV